MVDEVPDRDLLGEFHHAAEMIAVPMGGDEMVDPGQAGIPCGGHDAPGIPLRRIRRDIPGIDEHGFAGRRHVQRGVAAFDVDHIDVQRGPRLRHGTIGPRLDGQRHQTGRSPEKQILHHEDLPSDRAAMARSSQGLALPGNPYYVPGLIAA